MFSSLFPTWSNPLAITVLVGTRIFFNACLTAMVIKAAGFRTIYTAVISVTTLFSGVLTVLLLRPSGLGLRASYVEFVLQVSIVAVAGYVLYSFPSRTRRIVTALVFTGAIAFLLIMIPLYGEAFVAP